MYITKDKTKNRCRYTDKLMSLSTRDTEVQNKSKAKKYNVLLK